MATFEFALHAYNLLAINSQHTIVLNKWLNRSSSPVSSISFLIIYFFDKRGNITKAIVT